MHYSGLFKLQSIYSALSTPFVGVLPKKEMFAVYGAFHAVDFAVSLVIE
jgi:hypothetical protein